MSELYVKGVVIANGIPDSDGDILNKRQIKQLFTKYKQETDTMHTYIKNEGVEVIENWITEVPTQINGKDVPAGSWLATTKITNEELINSIADNKLNAFSLGSIPKEALTEKYWFINKSVNYRDIDDIENIQPMFISFVDRGANGYTFEVMSYDAYINKNDKNNEESKMNDKEVNQEDMVSISALEKIGKIFGINKAEDEEKPQEPPKEEETDDDISNKELLDSIASEVTRGVVDGLTEFAKQTREETPKEEEESEETPKEDENAEETPEEEETPKDKTDDVKINKRETKKIEDVETPQNTSSFYKKAGRDPFGCKIRK